MEKRRGYRNGDEKTGFQALQAVLSIVVGMAALAAIVVAPMAYVKAGDAKNDAVQAQTDAAQAQAAANESACASCSSVVSLSGVSFENSFNDNITTTFNVTNYPVTQAYHYLFTSNMTQNDVPVGTRPVLVVFERIGNIIVAQTGGFSATGLNPDDGNTLQSIDSVPDVFIPRRFGTEAQTKSPFSSINIVNNGTLYNGYWLIESNGKVTFSLALNGGISFANTIQIQTSSYSYSSKSTTAP
jgi:hypothetical protein